MATNEQWFDMTNTRISFEVCSERKRAHLKHGESSMVNKAWNNPIFLSVLLEEVGEVAKALNNHWIPLTNQPSKLAEELRKELIQVQAMAEEWTAAIDFVFHGRE